MRRNTNMCVVMSCDREVKYVEAQLCHVCYHGLNYWKGATPTRIMRRQKQLSILADRMDLLSNTRILKRRRA